IIIKFRNKMLIIKDEPTLSLLAQHCNMVQMIMNRDKNPQLKLNFDQRTFQQLIDWLQFEKLTCQSINEIIKFCKLADYLDCNIYDFGQYLVNFMKEYSYRQFGHVMLYCYEISNEDKELIDDYNSLLDKRRPLL